MCSARNRLSIHIRTCPHGGLNELVGLILQLTTATPITSSEMHFRLLQLSDIAPRSFTCPFSFRLRRRAERAIWLM
jgi:hypothetical protein